MTYDNYGTISANTHIEPGMSGYADILRDDLATVHIGRLALLGKPAIVAQLLRQAAEALEGARAVHAECLAESHPDYEKPGVIHFTIEDDRTTCENCGDDLPAPNATGRPRRFCTDACRQESARYATDRAGIVRTDVN
jgi:hypothetical protein